MIALLDACTLYPPALRDLFMWLATARVYQPRWTDAIHTEWIRSVLAKRSDVTLAQLERTRHLMDQVDPESLVTGYEHRIPDLRLPDADDRHVLAAAIEAQAAVVVTFNLSDFPSSALAPHGIAAIHPDAFLCQLMDMEEEMVLIGIRRHRASLRKPPKTVEEYLSTLHTNGLTRFVALLEGQKEAL
jgi:hypothetical protein